MTSILLGSAIVWGYVSYQASWGQYINSVAATLTAVSTVVVRTAETVEARRDLIEKTAQMLALTKNLINELRATTSNQAATSLPEIVKSIHSASLVVGRASITARELGEKLRFEVPTGIHWQGIRPIVVKSRPLEAEANNLSASAPDLKAISESLEVVSVNLGRDGPKLTTAFIATLDQSLKVLLEGEKTLVRVNSQDLPKAVADLKTTSENLRRISDQVDIVNNVGVALLVVGLLIAVWCFLHSMSTLALSHSKLVDGSR